MPQPSMPGHFFIGAQEDRCITRRIEKIETTSETLVSFQPTPPSLGRAVGGRTGAETITSVGLIAAIVLGSSGVLAQ